MEPLDMHVNVDHNFVAQRAHRIILQVERVFVPLHVAFPGKHLVANITGKLSALALVDLGDVDA